VAQAQAASAGRMDADVLHPACKLDVRCVT
jgi:hypothetical protein